MRRFICPNCNNQIHFDNTQCINCGSVLGYLPLQDQMLVLDDGLAAVDGGQHACANRNLIGCNWLCQSSEPDNLCLSCFHTTKIPNL